MNFGDSDNLPSNSSHSQDQIKPQTNQIQRLRKKKYIQSDQVPKRDEGINYYMKMMDTSFFNMPRNSDYYPTNQHKEKIYPNSLFPKYKMLNESMFPILDLDTLFFIFYFQKDQYEQYLAAKELKNKTWRFHKKYLTWFKRLEAPRITTEEYEQGTYVFFDYEKAWCQRKKTDFNFKYHYLEDETL